MLSLLGRWKKRGANGTPSLKRSRRRPWRPVLERLEDRTLLATGTWSNLTNAIPAEGIENMMLLTDGTVIAHGADNSGGFIGKTWYKLTPDSTGSYKNGTWSTLASMHDTRLYYYSGILKNGKVFVAGGEYGTGTNTVEVYNPLTNTWTKGVNSPQGDIGDTPGKVLPNGDLILGDRQSTAVRIYNPNTKTWTTAASNSNDNTSSEESWALLPEGTILDPAVANTKAFKYVISSDQWVSAGTVPVTLGSSGYEIGPSVLLPDGRVFSIGATGHTALYTPGANPTDPGSWTAGPTIPSGYVADDAPAAVMPNGHVLVVGDRGGYSGPSGFFEYDPGTNAFTSISAPNSTDKNGPSYPDRMLVLPTGQVLFSDSGSHMAIYTPSGGAQSSWQPTITSITLNSDGSYTVKGTQLNGLTEGAYYGDDANSSTNYPVIQLVSSSGTVYYARTYNFSTMGLGTGTKTVSARFTLPSGLPSGAYSVYAIANGIASAAFNFSFPSAGRSATTGGDSGGSGAAEVSAPIPLASLGAGQAAGMTSGTGSTSANHGVQVGAAAVTASSPGMLAVGGNEVTHVGLSGKGAHSSSATDSVFADTEWLSALD
jgi:hypothetical protein